MCRIVQQYRNLIVFVILMQVLGRVRSSMAPRAGTGSGDTTDRASPAATDNGCLPLIGNGDGCSAHSLAPAEAGAGGLGAGQQPQEAGLAADGF